MNNTKTINIVSNRNYESRKTSMLLSNKLKDAGYNTYNGYTPEAELTVVIGGDGAFLRAASRYNYPIVPFIGINTGHLGFFQEVNPQEIDQFIHDYKVGNYRKEELPLVGAEIFTKDKNYFLNGINEIVVKGNNSKIIHLDILIEKNHLEKFSGDGIIISTPLGSTAYNLSVGGSIVIPTLNTLQLTPMAPIYSRAYRVLPNSIVIPGESIITLRPEERYKDSTLIVVDGEEMNFKGIYKINFRISDKKIYRLTLNKYLYWDNLKSKFL